MNLTTEQLQKIKKKYLIDDDNIVFIATGYLYKYLGEERFNQSVFSLLDKVFMVEAVDYVAKDAPNPPYVHGNIVSEIKTIIRKYLSTIAQTLSQTTFRAITTDQAKNLVARLLADTAINLINSNDEFYVPDNHALQGLTLLITKAFNHEEAHDVEQIQQLLKKLFEKFPETKQIEAFNKLHLEIEAIIESNQNDYPFITFAKDTIGWQTKVDVTLLSDALAAFNRWKKNRNNYFGILFQITQLTDKLACKYPKTKDEIVAFSHLTFSGNLANKDFLAKYFIKFTEIIDILIALDDEHIASSLCTHLSNAQKEVNPWILIEIIDHPAFKKFSLSERRIILSVLTTLLNDQQPLVKEHLRYILDRCDNPVAKTALLRRLNEFYQRTPYPPLAVITEWIGQIANNNSGNIADALEASYVIYNNQKPSNEAILEKQLNKLKKDLDAYAKTTGTHTRKPRASYLSMFSTNCLTDLNIKTFDEKRTLSQQAITELYLHYSTIEDASSLLSRSLEKRLIKLLQIPQGDEYLNVAMKKREGFLYKIGRFFQAGRSFIKSYKDKDTDPVHQVILQHLGSKVKSQIKYMKGEIEMLDRQDSAETSLFGMEMLSENEMAEISDSILLSFKI